MTLERDYEKQFATSNNIRVLLKSVLTHLRAFNFVHMKTSLSARCVHACHSAQNLSRPVYLIRNMLLKKLNFLGIKPIELIVKGYLHYNATTFQKVSSEPQVRNYFIS